MKPTGHYTEQERRPMLRFKCKDCGAPPWIACRSKNETPAAVPHKSRVRAHMAKRTDAGAASSANT